MIADMCHSVRSISFFFIIFSTIYQITSVIIQFTNGMVHEANEAASVLPCKEKAVTSL